MSSQSSIGRALSGAITLARFDRRGMEYFDFSYDGFWRSFNAIALALPVVVAATLLTPAIVERLVELNPQLSESTVGYRGNMGLFVVIDAIAFIGGWAFFPVAMIWVARMLDLGDRYVPLIVARNWSRVVTAYVLRVPMILFAIGLIGDTVTSFLLFVAVVFLMVYRWFGVRVATDASGSTAFGLVLFDVLGTVLVQSVIDQLYWVFDPGTPIAAGNT